jgi:hypothetical protein
MEDRQLMRYWQSRNLGKPKLKTKEKRERLLVSLGQSKAVSKQSGSGKMKSL